MVRAMRARRLVAGAALLGIVGAGLAATAPSSAAPPPDSSGRQFRVLVFTGTTGGTHPATAAGVKAIRDLGKQLRFAVQVTADPLRFNAEELGHYRTVVFLNTSGDVLTDDQQAAFEEYYHSGGGFVGVGSAVETEPDWPFFTEILGTRATGRTDVQPGTIKVADRVHDARRTFPSTGRETTPGTTSRRTSAARATSSRPWWNWWTASGRSSCNLGAAS